MNNLNCFFITPIGEEDSNTRKKIEELFSNVITPALKNTYQVHVAHKISKIGDINEDVMEHICNDDLAIVNLTELNSNVLFELGIRYGIKKNFILIAEMGTKVPFDIFSERIIFYTHDEIGLMQLKNKLEKTVSNIKNKKNSDKFQKYIGRWIEIILNFPERPVAICSFSYDKKEQKYELQGHNYHYCQRTKDVYFESNFIINDLERKNAFYYITNPTIVDNTTGFGKINFLKRQQNGLTIAEGYFIDASNGQTTEILRQTKMIKCNKNFLNFLGVSTNKSINKINDNEIIKYSKNYLEENYGIEVTI